MRMILDKNVVLGLVILTAGSAFGQIEKGNIMIGSGLGFDGRQQQPTWFVTYPNSKNISATFLPELSYFVLKGLAVGITSTYSLSKLTQTPAKQDDPVASKSRIYMLGPCIRSYYSIKNMAVFTQLSYTSGTQITRDMWVTYVNAPRGGYEESNTLVINSKLSSLKVGIGLTYFISQKVGIESMLSYSKTHISYDPSQDAPTDLSVVGLNIGAQVYFNRHKSKE